MITNIVDRYVNIVKEEFKDYSKLILGKNFNTEIFNNYLENYIEARYYNFVEDANARTFRVKMINVIENIKEELYSKGIYKEEILILQCDVFKNLLTFDNVSTVQSEETSLKKLQEIYEQSNKDNNFRNKFIEKNVYYENAKNELKEKYKSKIFNVKYKKIAENIYTLNLGYNIKFSKIYSKDFLNTAFTTGVTNEDKLQVEYSLLSSDILNDIIEHNFKKKYIVELAETLLEKTKKIKGILNILNSPAIQEKVSFSITYKNFSKYKSEISKFMKLGYKFSLCLDETFKVNFTNIERLNMFEFVIVDTNLDNYSEIMKNKKMIKNLIEK